MKNRIVVLASCIAAFVLAGCVTAPTGTATRLSVFDPAEYAPYSAVGTGIIIGSAFMKTRGGDVRLGAGCMVSLNPVTRYSAEFFTREVIGYQKLQGPDPRAMKYNRLTTADARGDFGFAGLPAGDYYVHCSIAWEAPGVFRGSTVQTGGVAYARVRVQDGETVKVVLTR